MKRLFLILLFLFSAQAWAATWYVDSSASGSNNGTSRANAWTAFSGISTNTAPGDTILVYRGTGAAYARWTVAESGTNASTRIIIKGVDEGSGAPVSVGFNGAGFDYIAVIGMKFLHTSTATNYAFLAWSGAVGWLVQDNEFSTSYRDAISGTTGGNNNHIVRGNYFYNIGGIDGGSAGGASGTSFLNVVGDDNLVEYNTSSLGMDRVRPFGTRWVIRNNYWGLTDTTYYPSSSPYPFHSDSIQSYEGYSALIQLLYDRNYDVDNLDSVDTASNGHSFIVQDAAASNTFREYIYRFNTTIRAADSLAIFRGVDQVAFYNNTNISIGVDQDTLYNNAVQFESTGQSDYDFRNNTFSYCPNMIDSAGLISTSNRPSNFTSAVNHSYNTGTQAVLPTGASPANLAQSAPQFTDGDGTAGHDNYTLQSGSPLRATGTYATLANGAGSASVTLIVDNAYCLFDGWSIADADFISIGGGPFIQISSINYGTNTVTLATADTWSDNEAVVVRGMADVGSMPYGSATAPAISSGSITGGTATVTVSDSFNVRFVEILVDGLPAGTDYVAATNTYSVSSVPAGSVYTAVVYSQWASATPTVEQQIYDAGTPTGRMAGSTSLLGGAKLN